MAKDISSESQSSVSVSEPIAISLIAGRYLLFDINVVTHLRRNHNICGVLIGGIPQVPQQNIFLGLPLELLPEEARVLVEKKVAYIVDDASWHRPKFSALEGEDKKKYLESLRNAGLKAKKAALDEAKKRQVQGLAKQAARRAKNTSQDLNAINSSEVQGDTSSELLFNVERPQTPTPSLSVSPETPYAITSTTTYPPLAIPQNNPAQALPDVPSSYPLFAHLHFHNYFLTPGLRFGCDYTVYPGDPLRFHSHFLAVGYDWEEEIPMLDLVGGGRLGTGVKKGFLIGAKDPETKSNYGDSVRTFCIEWAGM